MSAKCINVNNKSQFIINILNCKICEPGQQHHAEIYLSTNNLYLLLDIFLAIAKKALYRSEL